MLLEQYGLVLFLLPITYLKKLVLPLSRHDRHICIYISLQKYYKSENINSINIKSTRFRACKTLSIISLSLSLSLSLTLSCFRNNKKWFLINHPDARTTHHYYSFFFARLKLKKNEVNAFNIQYRSFLFLSWSSIFRI